MENVFFILRNILYVKEAEMKIGLETTLSFLWEVFYSSIFHLLRVLLHDPSVEKRVLCFRPLSPFPFAPRCSPKNLRTLVPKKYLKLIKTQTITAVMISMIR